MSKGAWSRNYLFYFLLLTISTQASALVKANFAGFAFLGENQHLEENYPYSLALTKIKNPNGQSILDEAIIQELIKHDVPVNVYELAVLGRVCS